MLSAEVARSSAVTGVNDAEAVAIRIGENDEVRILRVEVPRHTTCAEAYQALNLELLFHGGIDDEVEVDSWMLLGRRVGPLQRHPSSLASRWNEDRESVVHTRKSNWVIPKHLRPKGHRPINVDGTKHNGSKANHTLSVTRPGRRCEYGSNKDSALRAVLHDVEGRALRVGKRGELAHFERHRRDVYLAT